jgi:hypothetical protein
MEGFDVRTIDGDKIGHVVDTAGDYLIVAHGLMRTKHALPQTFAEVDPGEQVVRTTLSKELVYSSPKVDGELDRVAVAEHYGLAEGFSDPPTRGRGDLEPDDPAYGPDGSLREHIEARREVLADEGPFDEPVLPGGSDVQRPRDYDGD